MKIKKILAVLLALFVVCSLLASCGAEKTESDTKETATETEPFVQPEYDKAASSVSKTETVYVNLDLSGKATQINVSDWLHTDETEVYVDDITTLKDVTNVKSEILPVKDGENLRWNMQETDLYYSGTGERDLPLKFDIQYKLDGKKISADKIGGKSGRVEITIKVENTEYKDVTINGKTHKIYLPLVVVGGLIMPEGVFSAVDVRHGQSIGDGSKEICVFMGMPGFSESLGINNEDLGEIGGLAIGDTFTISADTENFELGNIYFAALPIGSLNLDSLMPDSIDDLKSTFAALKTFQNAINRIDPDRVLLGLLTDEEKVTELMKMLTEAMTLYSDNKELLEVLGKYATPENYDALKSLMDTLSDPDMQKALDILTDPTVQLFFKKLPELTAELDEVSPVIEGLQKDLQDPVVAAQVDKLPETLEALKSITDTINDNSEALGILADALSEDGTQVIESLLENIDLSDLANLEEKYGSIAENGDLLISLAEQWLEFGKSYGLYTDSAEGMNTALAFVFNTPSVSGKEEEKTTEPVTEAQPWYKKIF